MAAMWSVIIVIELHSYFCSCTTHLELYLLWQCVSIWRVGGKTMKVKETASQEKELLNIWACIVSPSHGKSSALNKYTPWDISINWYLTKYDWLILLSNCCLLYTSLYVRTYKTCTINKSTVPLPHTLLFIAFTLWQIKRDGKCFSSR